MKALKQSLPIILMLLFEITVGIMLLINPESFTNMIIILFGVVLLLIGIVDLIKFFAARKKGKTNILTIIASVISLILGIICAFFSPFVMSLFAVIAIVYGVILIVSGVFKAQNYLQSRKEEHKLSIVTIISAVLSIILGIIVAVNPFGTTIIMWRFTGIVLLVESVVDCAAVILSARKAPDTV